jgi:hypothetical protein
MASTTLKVNRGTTYTIDFNYQKNGSAASLVGATVRFTIKTSEYDSDTSDSDALVKKNITDGDSSGNATISIDPSDTSTIAPGKYYYDIKVAESSGDVYKVVEGRLELDASPTNRLS